MALNLTKEMTNGVQVTYWKIAQDGVIITSQKKYSLQHIPEYNPYMCYDIMLPIIDENPQIQVIVFGYLDEAARRAGKEPILAVNASVPCPVEGNFADERRLLLYTELKKQDYFKDGIDC